MDSRTGRALRRLLLASLAAVAVTLVPAGSANASDATVASSGSALVAGPTGAPRPLTSSSGEAAPRIAPIVGLVAVRIAVSAGRVAAKKVVSSGAKKAATAATKAAAVPARVRVSAATLARSVRDARKWSKLSRASARKRWNRLPRPARYCVTFSVVGTGSDLAVNGKLKRAEYVQAVRKGVFDQRFEGVGVYRPEVQFYGNEEFLRILDSDAFWRTVEGLGANAATCGIGLVAEKVAPKERDPLKPSAD